MGGSLKYQRGKAIPQLVINSLRYVTKVGVMSRKTWYDVFAKGSSRWKRKQLQLLIEAKVYKRHPAEPIGGAVVIDEYGIKLIQQMSWQHVHSIPTRLIEHDETVGLGLLKIERDKASQKWMTEQELKMQKANSFKLSIRRGEVKYPDAVIKLAGQHTSPIVALEYEKTAKSNWRYNKLIEAYRKSVEINLIVFVVENLAIESCIKRAMSFIGDVQLNSKIGFMSVADWKSNPATSKIKGSRFEKSFSETVLES